MSLHKTRSYARGALPLLLTVALLIGCEGREVAYPGTVYQVSTLQALLAGMYDGQMTLGELKRHGGFGIGTFDALDGEMVVRDGVVYQVRFDGTVAQPPDSTTTPFANVTVFPTGAGQSLILPPDLDDAAFRALLDKNLPTTNVPFAVRVTGTFVLVKVRSVPLQSEPYPPLVEVVKHQSVFELRHVQGTIIGFRLPAYFQGINVAGYHLHFLTTDAQAGGHVLDFQVADASVEFLPLREVSLILPDSDAFGQAELSGDKTDEVMRVEQDPMATGVVAQGADPAHVD
ncbi:MAG: acetolactate decarboxylase [bacterium]|nr:acetolactate decarboxylase [bacterium]